MAVIAPRILFRERGSSMRSEAVTGSFTGAAVCGVADAAMDDCAAAVCDQAEPMQAHANNVTRIRFIEESPIIKVFDPNLPKTGQQAPRRRASRTNTMLRRSQSLSCASLYCCMKTRFP